MNENEIPFHLKDLGYNLATSNRFVVTIPIPNVMRDYLASKGFSSEVLEMNIFGMVTPSFDFSPIRVPYVSGRSASIIGNQTKSDPVKFEFMVDDKFFNWFLLFYWAIKCRDHTTGIAHRWAGANKEQPADWSQSSKIGNEDVSPYVNVSITSMDNFNRPVLRTTLLGAHPARLEGIKAVQQEGAEAYVKSGITLSYDESNVEWLL